MALKPAVFAGYHSGIYSDPSNTEGWLIGKDHAVIGYDLKISFSPPVIPMLKNLRGPHSITVIDETYRRFASFHVAAETLKRAVQLIETAKCVEEAVHRLKATQTALITDAEKTQSKVPLFGSAFNPNPQFYNYNLEGSSFHPAAIMQVRNYKISPGISKVIVDEKHRRILSVQLAAETLKRAEKIIEDARHPNHALDRLLSIQAELLAQAQIVK
jgi:hypothetical protein